MTVNFQDHDVLSAPNNIGYNQEQCLLLLTVVIKCYFLHLHTEAKKLFNNVESTMRLIRLAGIKLPQ